jgi:hypothetical protein
MDSGTFILDVWQIRLVESFGIPDVVEVIRKFFCCTSTKTTKSIFQLLIEGYFPEVEELKVKFVCQGGEYISIPLKVSQVTSQLRNGELRNSHTKPKFIHNHAHTPHTCTTMHTHNHAHTQPRTCTTAHIHNHAHTQPRTYTTTHIHNHAHTQPRAYTTTHIQTQHSYTTTRTYTCTHRAHAHIHTGDDDSYPTGRH